LKIFRLYIRIDKDYGNIFEYDTKDIENLKLFHRDTFDVASINKYAEEMVYVKGMTHFIGNLLRSPSEDFIRFLVSELGTIAPNYEIQGRITGKVIDKFKPIVKKSSPSSPNVPAIISCHRFRYR
jgi:predicted type IV restriction endonuclease